MIWATTSCMSSYAGMFTAKPPTHREPTVTDEEVRAGEAALGRIAAGLGMTRMQPPADDVRKRLERLYDDRLVVQYSRQDPGPGKRAVVLSFNLPNDRSHVEVVIRDLGHSEETELVARLRAGVERELRAALRGFEIEFESAKVDATFAP